MGMSGPGASASTPADKKRPEWIVGGATILAFVALMYVIEAIDAFLLHGRLDYDGIHPREWDGLWGILWAPLLHGGWDHLNGNAPFALVLGFLMTLMGMGRFVAATAIVWILGGLGTWVIGSAASTIGASGLIMGWLTFLIVFGFFTRQVWQIVVGIIVFFVYGSVLLGVFPGTLGVSWQGHLCGAIAGVIAAYLLSGPERKARVRRKVGVPPKLAA
jgi:membrane associated rhomboid family serine protease